MALTKVSRGLLGGSDTKNLIINGKMEIDQRNGGAVVTGSSAIAKFAADRFQIYANTTGTVTLQQVSDAPVGFQKSNKVTCTVADSPSAGRRVQFLQTIEGYNFSQASFGTSSAKSVTLSFYVKSSLTGNFGASLVNGSATRSYPFHYTINSANTWEKQTITIVGDTSGTWSTDNTTALHVLWGLGTGSTYEGTADQWNSAFNVAPPSSVSLKDNVNATWQITGVQLEVGSVATEFEHRSYGEELALCQRYFWSQVPLGSATGSGDGQHDIGIGQMLTSNQIETVVTFPVTMRVAPTLDVAGGTDYFAGESAGNNLDKFNTLQSYALRPQSALIYRATSSELSGTAGQAVRITAIDPNAYLYWDAEL